MLDLFNLLFIFFKVIFQIFLNIITLTRSKWLNRMKSVQLVLFLYLSKIWRYYCATLRFIDLHSSINVLSPFVSIFNRSGSLGLWYLAYLAHIPSSTQPLPHLPALRHYIKVEVWYHEFYSLSICTFVQGLGFIMDYAVVWSLLYILLWIVVWLIYHFLVVVFLGKYDSWEVLRLIYKLAPAGICKNWKKDYNWKAEVYS